MSMPYYSRVAFFEVLYLEVLFHLIVLSNAVVLSFISMTIDYLFCSYEKCSVYYM